MIYISLGSNKGHRLGYLQRAAELVRQRYMPDLQCSIVIETPAILPDGAPPEWDIPYLNMVIAGTCALSPDELLAGLKAIEREIGRPENYQVWSPRVIDLDILLWDDHIVDTPHLKIPHVQLLNRPFLLHLLALMNPTLRVGTQTAGALAYAIPDINDCFTRSMVLSQKFIGVVNVTPDSFSDGGLYRNTEQAARQARQLTVEGASIIELGAQSTRPGAKMLDVETEYARLHPVLKALQQDMMDGMHISIDTFQPETIRRVLDDYPVTMINDVTGSLDDDTLHFIAQKKCRIAMMHAVTVPPEKTKIIPENVSPMETINQWAEQMVIRLRDCGFDLESIVLDPGIGFGKSAYQNIDLLRSVEQLQSHGYKIMMGHSRKSFMAAFTKADAAQRDLETIAISSAIEAHADYLRVHNVADAMRFCVARHVVQKCPDIK